MIVASHFGLGPFCTNAGISKDSLTENNVTELPRLPEQNLLVNGIIYELGQFRMTHNIEWRFVEQWIAALSESFLPTVTFNCSNLKASVERILKKVKNMKRNKKDWRAFLEQPYNLPKYRITRTTSISVKQDTSKLTVLAAVNRELALDLHHTKNDLDEMKSRGETLSEKLLDEKITSKNRYKQLKRRDDTLQQQKQQMVILSHDHKEQQKRYESAVAEKERLRSKVNYAAKKTAGAKQKYDTLNCKLHDTEELLCNKVTDLEEVIKNIETEYDNLLLKNDDDQQSEKVIHAFHSGKFEDSIRQCCIELLSLNVGVRNVEPIIRSVLFNCADIDIDRLPKYSTLVGMLSEMKVIAYRQLSEELAESKFTTLHSDGTTKFGQHYGSFQISTEKSAYTLGLMDMSSGTAQHTLDCLKNILSDIDKAFEKSPGKRILANIKNTMSDRHIVEKCFNTLLEEYRSDILPSVVEGWETLTPREQAKISNLNHFFCGMHLVVGMADTAASTLKEWESAHFESPQGAAALPKAFTRSEAGGCMHALHKKSINDYIAIILHACK